MATVFRGYLLWVALAFECSTDWYTVLGIRWLRRPVIAPLEGFVSDRIRSRGLKLSSQHGVDPSSRIAAEFIWISCPNTEPANGGSVASVMFRV